MWLIEHTNVAQKEVMKTKNALDILGFKYDFFGFEKQHQEFYFNQELDIEKESFIVRPSISALKAILNNSTPLNEKLKKDIGYIEDNFNQDYYIKNIDLPFLNENSFFLEIKKEEDLSVFFETKKFVKPVSDLKFFNAGIIEERKTLKMIFEEQGVSFEKMKGKTILFADVKEIHGEYRHIFIGDELVGVSKYLEKGQLDIFGDVPQKIMSHAKEFAKVYHPSEIFTLDLCELSNGKIEIVEFNAWNTSGLYNIDRVKLFKSINDFYNINKKL